MFSREQLITTLKNVGLYNSASQICHIAQLILRQPKRLKNRLFPGTIILLYHRVINLKTDPQLLAVSPEHFYEHMKCLKNNYNIISLDDLKRAMNSGKLPKKSVVITFDDGYADNIYNAKPILEEFNIPATVFITTGMTGTKKEFWWDELEHLMLLSESLPESLTLTINDKIHSWKMESLSSSNSFDPEKYRQWNVTMNYSPTPRHQAYRELCSLLRPMYHSTQQKVLNELTEWSELDENFRLDYRALSADEILALTEDGLIEVGGHTQTHAMLASLSYQNQKKEIEENKKCLEVTARSDLFWLPRFLVRDWDGEEFAMRIRGFFNG
jgi:peptidoglycan/xylan/chitin deacetylase (PgdA/CDA1 family)